MGIARLGPVHVRLGKSGDVEVRRDAPSQDDRLWGALHGMPLRRRSYTRLLDDGRVLMTDAEFELRTNEPFVAAARGDVLIAGLGLGMIVRPLLKRSAISSITVIEIRPEVRDIIAPQLWGQKLLIEIGDARTYVPRMQFDAIYLDIWGDYDSDIVRQDAAALKARYRNFLRPGGWLAAWPDFCGRRAA